MSLLKFALFFLSLKQNLRRLQWTADNWGKKGVLRKHFCLSCFPFRWLLSTEISLVFVANLVCGLVPRSYCFLSIALIYSLVRLFKQLSMSACSHQWYAYACPGTVMTEDFFCVSRKNRAVDWSIGMIWDEHFVTVPTVRVLRSPIPPHTDRESALPDAQLHWHNIARQIFARCPSIVIDPRESRLRIRESGDWAWEMNCGWLSMHLNFSFFKKKIWQVSHPFFSYFFPCANV